MSHKRFQVRRIFRVTDKMIVIGKYSPDMQFPCVFFCKNKKRILQHGKHFRLSKMRFLIKRCGGYDVITCTFRPMRRAMRPLILYRFCLRQSAILLIVFALVRRQACSKTAAARPPHSTAHYGYSKHLLRIVIVKKKQNRLL